MHSQTWNEKKITGCLQGAMEHVELDLEQSVTALSFKYQPCLLHSVERVCFSSSTFRRTTEERWSKEVAVKVSLKYNSELNIMTHNSIQMWNTHTELSFLEIPFLCLVLCKVRMMLTVMNTVWHCLFSNRVNQEIWLEINSMQNILQLVSQRWRGKADVLIHFHIETVHVTALFLSNYFTQLLFLDP